jgi:hypothetical protein
VRERATRTEVNPSEAMLLLAELEREALQAQEEETEGYRLPNVVG